MSEWVDVEAVDALPPGSVKVVDVDGVMIAVFNIDGEFFAIEDVCTHDGAEIASGCLEGDEIECPRHGARFSVRTRLRGSRNLRDPGGESYRPGAGQPLGLTR
jgi:3-phenylpropionate/trans-cinnamate dioxygenase ferredoxin subunit